MKKEEASEETIINLRSTMVPELPIKSVTKILTQTSGKGLKQNTRANRGLVEAVMFAFPYVYRWGNKYVGEMVDDLMCMAISMDGEGRKEAIDSLRAAGTVPDAYYSGKNSGSSDRDRDTSYVRAYE